MLAVSLVLPVRNTVNVTLAALSKADSALVLKDTELSFSRIVTVMLV